MSTQLYPLKFTPILKDKIWGGTKLKSVLAKNSKSDTIGESWEISGVEGDTSVVSNGFLKGNALDEIIEIYMGDIVGDEVFNKFGTEFPLLFKFIDATQDLSIQVHPDDKLSAERHNAYGKTEMWYVLDADSESQLISGFNKESNKDEYLEALKSGQLLSLLKSHSVNSGDVFFIPAGNIHAIGTGVLLAEIQQTSDVTYRIYDYDREDANGNLRELHTDLALEANDYKSSNDKIAYELKADEAVNLAECPYFITNVIDVNKRYDRDVYLLNSFVVYMCVEGEAKLTYDGDKTEALTKGESVLVPASLGDIFIESSNGAKLLEIYIKK